MVCFILFQHLFYFIYIFYCTIYFILFYFILFYFIADETTPLGTETKAKDLAYATLILLVTIIKLMSDHPSFSYEKLVREKLKPMTDA